MDETKCQKCDMPLDGEHTCSCNAQICIYCCECEPGCSCGCREK